MLQLPKRLPMEEIRTEPSERGAVDERMPQVQIQIGLESDGSDCIFTGQDLGGGRGILQRERADLWAPGAGYGRGVEVYKGEFYNPNNAEEVGWPHGYGVREKLPPSQAGTLSDESTESGMYVDGVNRGPFLIRWADRSIRHGDIEYLLFGDGGAWLQTAVERKSGGCTFSRGGQEQACDPTDDRFVDLKTSALEAEVRHAALLCAGARYSRFAARVQAKAKIVVAAIEAAVTAS